jgi:hypothetical protein
VKSAFEQVIKHSQNPEEWRVGDNYRTGLEGFDSWIKSVSDGTANGFGLGYNTAVWAECRRYAVEFLKEASSRVEGDYGDAIKQYETVAECLGEVEKLYPHPVREEGPIGTQEKGKKVAEILQTARSAEAKGLDAIAEIARTL